jgi:pimeloyl-ACP methyl ester carboxylesterase
LKVFLSDGRALRYWSSATQGPIVLFFHGCPDTRRMAMTGVAAAREVGVRLLAFNRPGYGSSTLTPSTHTTVAHDAAEVLDVWGIEQAAVLGMSVGSTYAAAFAACHPERTTGLALVAPPAQSLTESDGSVEDAVERLRPGFMQWRASIDPEDEDDAALAARFLAEMPEADAALLRQYDDEFLGYLAFEALVKPEGYLRDAALLYRKWDFDPSAVRSRTTVWCGGLDEQAVVGARWWAERIPQAEVHVKPHTTHLATLLTQWPEILRDLAAGRETGHERGHETGHEKGMG